MGLIKHFFVINSRGNPIAVRSFLEEKTQDIIEAFFQRIVDDPPPPPVFRVDGLNYAFIIYNNLYFVLATPDSMSPVVLIELLRRLTTVLADYIGKCTETAMQKSLALVYEVVDEVLSFGCPQATDASSLLHLVHNTVLYDQNFLTEFIQTELFPGEGFNRPLALPIEQRTKSNNEVFLVISEKVSMTLTSSNQIIQSVISGMAYIKSFLQGQPSVMIQFDPQMYVTGRAMPQNLMLKFDDVTFAPFVVAGSFDSDRSITLAPPDGSTNIMSYRTTRNINPPFTFSAVFENKQTKVIVVRVSIQSTFATEVIATDVAIRFQCPVEISNASCELPSSVQDTQSSEFDSKNRQVIWKLSKFPAMSEYSARFRFIFDDGIPCAAETLLGPVAVDFNITGKLLSGLSVKNFLVSTLGTPSSPHRWYKEAVTAGSYTFNFL